MRHELSSGSPLIIGKMSDIKYKLSRWYDQTSRKQNSALQRVYNHKKDMAEARIMEESQHEFKAEMKRRADMGLVMAKDDMFLTPQQTRHIRDRIVRNIYEKYAAVIEGSDDKVGPEVDRLISRNERLEAMKTERLKALKAKNFEKVVDLNHSINETMADMRNVAQQGRSAAQADSSMRLTLNKRHIESGLASSLDYFPFNYISFRENTLTFWLREYKLRHNGTEYKMVPLKFKLNLDHMVLGAAEQVSFEGLETPVHGNPSYPHPHISGNWLCWGEGKTAASNALKRGDLVSFLDTLWSILKTYNAESPYARIENFAPDSIDSLVSNENVCQDCRETIDIDDIDDGEYSRCEVCEGMMHSHCGHYSEWCDQTLCSDHSIYIDMMEDYVQTGMPMEEAIKFNEDDITEIIDQGYVPCEWLAEQTEEDDHIVSFDRYQELLDRHNQEQAEAESAESEAQVESA